MFDTHLVLALLTCASVSLACPLTGDCLLPDVTLRAVCHLKDPSGANHVHGTVHFTQTRNSDIQVDVTVRGLSSETDGKGHGFHVHSYGDISSSCATTGGHFDPHDVDHGGPDDEERHPGDFGNLIQSDTGGTIDTSFTDHMASLFGEHSIIGRAIVIHAGEDDYGDGTGDKEAGSKASGNAGARLACCVIGIAKD